MVETPAPAPVVVPIEAPAAEIAAKPVDLASAGLVMIETSATAATPVTPEPPVQLGRKPRPPVTIAEEPLQMVETRQP